MRFIHLTVAVAAAAEKEEVDKDGSETHPNPRAFLQLWQRRWVRRKGNPKQINMGVFLRGDKKKKNNGNRPIFSGNSWGELRRHLAPEWEDKKDLGHKYLAPLHRQEQQQRASLWLFYQFTSPGGRSGRKAGGEEDWGRTVRRDEQFP